MNHKRPLRAILLCLLLCGCTDRSVPAEPSPAPSSSPPPVTVGEQELVPETRELEISGSEVTAPELRAAVYALPELRELSYPLCPFTPEEQLALTEEFPDIAFRWTVELGGKRVDNAAETLDLRNTPEGLSELAAILPLFPDLREADLSGREVTGEEASALYAACPDALFRYSTELYGRSFETDAEELDLHELPLTDTQELEAALVHFPRLKKVDMCDCGLDNETMDALNQRHPGIEFVWIVQVFCHGIRTDTTYYSMFNAERAMYPGVGVGNFRYCHDLIALDLGHAGCGNQDLDFLSGTPHLKYLILAECYITDVTPLAQLKELTYLELFMCPVYDLSPLQSCTELTDLNISYCNCLSDDCVDTLVSLKKLERLWYFGQRLGPGCLDAIREALPDCQLQYIKGPESTGGGWRDHPHYYEMRDALHMYYMQ